MKRGMSRWDSLPTSSPVSCGPQPICQEKHWAKLPCGTAMPGDSHLQTVSHQSDATSLYWQANYSLPTIKHALEDSFTSIRTKPLFRCWILGMGEDPRLLWQKTLWRVNIKTDGAPGLSGWMADHITPAALWELIPPIRYFFKVHTLFNLNWVNWWKLYLARQLTGRKILIEESSLFSHMHERMCTC